MKPEKPQFVHTLSTGVHTPGVDRKTPLPSAITAFLVLCPYCPYVQPIKLDTKENVMKSIEAYRYRVKNRQKGMDGMDKTPTPITNPPVSADIPKSVFRPINIKPEYMEDFDEREAILVIDGGVDPDVASLRAAAEIVERYGSVCLIGACSEMEIK